MTNQLCLTQSWRDRSAAAVPCHTQPPLGVRTTRYHSVLRERTALGACL